MSSTRRERWADIEDTDSEPEDFPCIQKIWKEEKDESSPVDTPRAESESCATTAGSSAGQETVSQDGQGVTIWTCRTARS